MYSIRLDCSVRLYFWQKNQIIFYPMSGGVSLVALHTLSGKIISHFGDICLHFKANSSNIPLEIKKLNWTYMKHYCSMIYIININPYKVFIGGGVGCGSVGWFVDLQFSSKMLISICSFPKKIHNSRIAKSYFAPYIGK